MICDNYEEFSEKLKKRLINDYDLQFIAVPFISEQIKDRNVNNWLTDFYFENIYTEEDKCSFAARLVICLSELDIAALEVFTDAIQRENEELRKSGIMAFSKFPSKTSLGYLEVHERHETNNVLIQFTQDTINTMKLVLGKDKTDHQISKISKTEGVSGIIITEDI